MKQKYIHPEIVIINIVSEGIICNSDNSKKYICNDVCKFWHICRDRHEGKHCFDKRYIL